MKASFVIPAYNAAGFLAETIESCLRQTEKDIEVVIVNDGSTDSTGKIIDHYASVDKRVRHIQQENKGRSAARNRGIEEAKSDVILTLDADDLAYPSRAKETLALFKKKPNVSIIYTAFQLIDPLGTVLETIPAEPFDFEKVKDTGFTYIGHSTMAFRKNVFEKVKYSDGDYCKHAIDDWKFQTDCHKAGFVFSPINKVLGAYRIIYKKRDEEKIKELKDACLVS